MSYIDFKYIESIEKLVKEAHRTGRYDKYAKESEKVFLKWQEEKIAEKIGESQ